MQEQPRDCKEVAEKAAFMHQMHSGRLDRGRTIGSGAAARILGCSTDTLRMYRQLGLPHFATPTPSGRPSYRYNEGEVRAWLRGFAVNAPAALD